MRRLCAIVLVLGVCAILPVRAENPIPDSKDEATHKELVALREGMLDAVEKVDIDKLLTYLDDNVVVTYMNAEVARKPEGVREYYEKMMKGPNPRVKSYKPNVEVDEKTHLYGDAGVVTGSSRDHFVLNDGREFDIDVRWTATVVKKDGKWKVAGFHSSANVFDNPILTTTTKETSYVVGGAAGLGGLMFGLIIGALFLRRRRT
jgi:hypothetical protein